MLHSFISHIAAQPRLQKSASILATLNRSATLLRFGLRNTIVDHAPSITHTRAASPKMWRSDPNTRAGVRASWYQRRMFAPHALIDSCAESSLHSGACREHARHHRLVHRRLARSQACSELPHLTLPHASVAVARPCSLRRMNGGRRVFAVIHKTNHSGNTTFSFFGCCVRWRHGVPALPTRVCTLPACYRVCVTGCFNGAAWALVTHALRLCPGY